jgi:hypothetical protein
VSARMESIWPCGAFHSGPREVRAALLRPLAREGAHSSWRRNVEELRVAGWTPTRWAYGENITGSAGSEPLIAARILTLAALACSALWAEMFQDLLHFQQLDCTAAVAYSAPDYTLSDPNGNVFCAFTKQTATDKARSAKDGEWATFTGSTTITVCPLIPTLS